MSVKISVCYLLVGHKYNTKKLSGDWMTIIMSLEPRLQSNVRMISWSSACPVLW